MKKYIKQDLEKVFEHIYGVEPYLMSDITTYHTGETIAHYVQ